MKKIIAAATSLLILAGCYNDKYNKLYPLPATPTTCDTTSISYTSDIQPIIVANCYNAGNGCHDAVGSATSGYDYETSITALQANALSGALVTDINWAPIERSLCAKSGRLARQIPAQAGWSGQIGATSNILPWPRA